jgi:mannose-6-phosphate isomerase-like protein (cupin superfamily)
MNENYDHTNLIFKDKVELIAESEKLISESVILDPILNEIQNLERGKVRPEDTIKRSKIGSYFTSKIQQIFNYVYDHEIVLKEDIKTKLNEIISKADAILRENIVLQSKAPLDVIKFENVPVRYCHSILGGKEQRWGYGLHKLPTTELGYSLCLADMPPEYIQSYHNHTISEYCLALDKKVTGNMNPGKNETKNNANRNEIIYFSATTPHTLSNTGKSMSRNITVKNPIGLTDWRPIYDLNRVESTSSEVIKGKLSQFNGSGTKISFSIKDKFYDYGLELLELKEDSVMEDVYSKDKYFFVIEGDLQISSGKIKKQCSKSDFIVVDENTPIKIETKTKTRLYTLN